MDPERKKQIEEAAIKAANVTKKFLGEAFEKGAEAANKFFEPEVPYQQPKTPQPKAAPVVHKKQPPRRFKL